jgi:hypothetical protein
MIASRPYEGSTFTRNAQGQRSLDHLLPYITTFLRGDIYNVGNIPQKEAKGWFL